MKILNTRILKKSVITLSFLCYLITCGFVPYYYDEATNLCYGDGFFNLFFGWFCFVFPGIFTKIYSLAWFSNITYIVAIRHLIKGNRKHFVLWICITIILSSDYLSKNRNWHLGEYTPFYVDDRLLFENYKFLYFICWWNICPV